MKDYFSCDISSDDQTFPQISTPKPFQNIKFLKELNFMQNQRYFRQKKIRDRRMSNSINFIVEANLNRQKQIQAAKDCKKQIVFNGHIIKNSFKKRKLNGSTQIQFESGVNFQGILKDGKFKSGTFDFKNGYIYDGQLNGKKFYGKGTLTCPDGKKITGVWNGDIIDGKTQIVYSNGDIYYGQTLKCKKHGQGYMFFNDGSKYSGQFKEGKITGYGSYFNKENQQFKGIWKDGKLVGRCSLIQNSEVYTQLKQSSCWNGQLNETNFMDKNSKSE